jgi:hypothetical protein
MQPRVYVETSIPSFYFEVRTEPEMLARREWTRTWWSSAAKTMELVTSVAVIDELDRGVFPARASCQDLIAALPVVSVDRPVIFVESMVFSDCLVRPW